MPAIFQTSASNEMMLWFFFGLLAGVYIVSLIDRAWPEILDSFDQFDDNNRDERTVMGVTSRDPKAQGAAVGRCAPACRLSSLGYKRMKDKRKPFIFD